MFVFLPVLQLHPLGLCNTNDYDERYGFGWVGVVKLERPELEPEPCLSVFGKVSIRVSCCCEYLFVRALIVLERVSEKENEKMLKGECEKKKKMHIYIFFLRRC